MDNNNKLVGIVSYNTHSYHLNYGTVLHSYAFQQYLKKKGVDSVILDYIPNNLEHYNEKWPILNYEHFWHVRTYLLHLRDWGIGWYENLKKYNKFQNFYNTHYKKTRYAYTCAQLKTMTNVEGLPVSIWVCESDVIWKLYSEGGFDDIFYLYAPFAENTVKVAYSPSMGSRKFTEGEKTKFLEMTSSFRAISCREKEPADYVASITGRDVPWVLDPTLLLDAEDYNKVAKDPEEQHYLLCFNCMKNDKDMVRESCKLADKLGLKMIEISNYDQNKFTFKHKVRTDVGIEEFLGYFKNADFIVCSSFHGCCFAITYRKQFFLFQRDKTDTRMPSITKALHCYDRMISCESKKIPDTFEPIDYEPIVQELKTMRELSYKYIDDNIINV